MLEHLRIRDLGVIEDAEFELAPGLTVLTGETGAGKTMVVTALGLLLAARADAGAVRPGAAGALVEGRFALPANSPARVRAAEAGAELDEGSLIVARSVSAEGRSRAHVGGRAVPLAALGEIADDLVAVSGQSAQRRLLLPAHQRAALDRFAGSAGAEPLADYSAAYEQFREVDRLLTELTTRSRDRLQEADLLRAGVREIERVAPHAGEEDELRAEAARLSHAEALHAAAEVAHGALLADAESSDAADAVGLVGGARRALDAVRNHDPQLAALADRLAEVSYLLADVATDLAAYARTVDDDPQRLAAVADRRAAITALLRRYGDTTGDVLAWAAAATTRLGELEGDDERIEAAKRERESLLGRLSECASRLSAARQVAAGQLADVVTAELQALAMPAARLTVVIRQAADPSGLAIGKPGAQQRVSFGPGGVDAVELLLAPHPGAPARPVGRGASGGELSRILLALEAGLAGADAVPTFVFDEVDAGVGGRAAVEVGRRLARLARAAQVLVVTHLPQVAAFADRHLLVAKTDDGRVTRSGVTELNESGRVQELSRMLAGLEGSDTAVAHAEELLASALAERSSRSDRTGSRG